jgi:WD40 repeat protein
MMAAFNRDGSRAVLVPDVNQSDVVTRVWDTTNWRPIATLAGQEGQIKWAAFSRDGSRIVTASYDKAVRIWYASNGSQILARTGHQGNVNTVAFGATNDQYVSASDDRTARIWGPLPVVTIPMPNARGITLAFAATPFGVRYVKYDGPNDDLQVLDGSNALELTEIKLSDVPGPRPQIGFAAFSADGSRIVTAVEALWGDEPSSLSTAQVWNATTGQLITSMQGGAVEPAAFNPDGTRVATGSFDKLVRIWDVSNGKVITELRGHESRVNSVPFSPDGLHVVTGSYDEPSQAVRIWDVKTGQQIGTLKGHNALVDSIHYSRDGTLIIAGSEDNTARIWDAATRQPIRILNGQPDARLSLMAQAQFSPDTKRVLTSSINGEFTIIWSAESGRMLARLYRPGVGETLNYAFFEPDGMHVTGISVDPDGFGGKTTWDVSMLSASAQLLLSEVWSGPLANWSRLTRAEMATLGYPDDTAEIAVCDGVSR